MKVYRYTRGYDGKRPYLTQRENVMHSTDYYVGGGMNPHTLMPRQKPHVLAIKEKLFEPGKYVSDYVSYGDGTEKKAYIPGYLSHYTRVPSPPHVMRWRFEIPGTGQETPVYSYIEIVADVNGSRPRLP